MRLAKEESEEKMKREITTTNIEGEIQEKHSKNVHENDQSNNESQRTFCW